ncbi:MAG: Arc family DNA-binding protein [Planctomycetes bacterium]|nr:Arc family DNA-binding protein [Planctomycetota bacterium]
MARRDSFLLRTDPEVMRALKRWAQDDLRSMNSQIEFVLRRALREQGRLKQPELSVDQASDSGVRR